MSDTRQLPSSMYVFVVMSLAAFLALLTISHRPRTQYLAQVQVTLAQLAGDASDFALVREALLRPETVLDGLRAAGMVDGDSPELLEIAAEIAGRMRVESLSKADGLQVVRVSLLTDYPDAAMRLLNQMVAFHQNENATTPAALARADRIRGSAITPTNLLLIIMCSGLVGLGGLVWLEHTQSVPLLLTEKDVSTATHLPVLVDFSGEKTFPARARQFAKERRFQVALRFAEAGIAAAVLLMAVNAATVPAFASLFSSDPFTAYSEAITRILG